MPVSTSFVDYVREQLTGLGEVSSRRMFGGVGLYRDGQFFGLIDDDTLYFKVDERNRGEYLARGMEPFRPYRDRPDRSMSYFQVPVDVIEDAEQLTGWARAAVRAALDSPPKSAARERPRAGVQARRTVVTKRIRGKQ
jgi:DNA transformation protein